MRAAYKIRLPFTYITLSTSSGVMLTLSTICGFLPQILISLFAGVWVDRYNRKRMIMLADGAIAAATLALALLFLAGYHEIWLLYPILLIRAAGTGIQVPAVNALIPQLVPHNRLMKVNGMYSSMTSLIMSLSPAAGGAILTAFPIETVFLVDVITAIIGISLMQVSNSCALPLGMMLFGPLADLIMIETLLLYCGFLVLACTLFVYFSKRYTYTFQYGKKSRFYSGPQAVEFISAASIIINM